MNIAVVCGTLSSPPRSRTLASGSELLCYEITTVLADGSRRSVPVVWLDPVRPPALVRGDEVAAVGVVRRRFFRVGGATQSRTEIEAVVVARGGSSRASKAMRKVVDNLQMSEESGG